MIQPPHCLKWITQHSEIINKSAKDIVFAREGQEEIILGLQKSLPHFTSPCGFSPISSQIREDIIQIKSTSLFPLQTHVHCGCNGNKE